MDRKLITVGWREWVSLPHLNIQSIKAKIDTGARTSCLHAFSIQPFQKNKKEWVRFGMHPEQQNTELEVYCEAEVVDKRIVTDSGGHKEERYVIITDLVLSEQRWPIEITLSNRESMLFRMLLGRTAMENRILVNPHKSFLSGKQTAEKQKDIIV